MAKKREFYYKTIKYEAGKVAMYRGYEINVGKGNDGYNDCYQDILDKLIDHIEAERSRFNRLFIGRFELYFNENIDQPTIEKQSEIISALMNLVKTYLQKKVSRPAQPALRNHSNVKIGWNREHAKGKGWHYHAYICLDGEKVFSWQDKTKPDAFTHIDNPIITTRSKPKDLYSLIDHYWHSLTGDCYQPVHLNNPQKGGKKNNSFLIGKV